MNDEYQWFAGIDWASEEHGDGEVLEERAFAHSGEGLADLVAWLIDKTGAHPVEIAVGIEVPHGAVVETLLDAGLGVFSINPKQSDRFRDRFSLAGAKDDRFDARVIASAVRTDRQHLRHLRPVPDVIVELREWSRIHHELKAQRSRLISRFNAQLLRYYPAFRMLCKGTLGAAWTLGLWDLAPNPKTAKKTTGKIFAANLKKNRIRKMTGSEVRKKLTAKPLNVSPATTTAAVAHIRLLVEQLRLLNCQLKRTEHEVSTCLEKLSVTESTDSPEKGGEHSDVELLLSLPGVGQIVAAAMLSEASHALRERDHGALRSHCGVAPVTRASGGSRRVVMRKACSERLRNAVYHWARVAMQHDELSRAKYRALRARGHSHGRALRTIADRLLAVLCAMLKTHTLFNPSRTALRTQNAVKSAA